MAKKDKGEEAAAAEGEEKKGGKKKLIIIAAVVLLVVGGGGYFFLGRGGDDKAKPPPKEGEVLIADSIHINLAEGHFLKVGIALQGVEGPKHEPNEAKALDATISLFSGRPIDELQNPRKRDELKEKLKEHIVEAYHEDIMDIYFTEFVVQ